MRGETIRAQSAGPGKGSEFIVDLPRAQDATSEMPAPENDVTKRGGSRRILVVDDNEGSAVSLAMLLHFVGHETYTAKDGGTALQLVHGARPDAAVFDIGMPGMSGLEVAQ